MSWEQFVDELATRRECGEVVGFLRCWNITPGSPDLHGWLTDVGFEVPHGLPNVNISEMEAAQVVTNLLKYDLAYNAPLPTYWEADNLALRFLEFQLPETSFFTNSRMIQGNMATRSWTPLTSATFDAGVLAVHPTQTSVLWFKDED